MSILKNDEVIDPFRLSFVTFMTGLPVHSVIKPCIIHVIMLHYKGKNSVPRSQTAALSLAWKFITVLLCIDLDSDLCLVTASSRKTMQCQVLSASEDISICKRHLPY